MSVIASSDGRQREHPRDVDRDVAGPDDDRVLGLQVDLEARCGRGGRCTRRRTRSPRASRAAPRPGSRAACRSPCRSCRGRRGSARAAARAVMSLPSSTCPKNRNRSCSRGLVVGRGDRLDLRMVRSDARPDEPVRRRQAVVQVDGELRLVDGQQLTGGVEAARAGADDRGTKGRAGGHVPGPGRGLHRHLDSRRRLRSSSKLIQFSHGDNASSGDRWSIARRPARGAGRAQPAGFEGELVMVGEEAHRPYTRPPLSKELLAGEHTVDKVQLPCDELDAQWRLGAAATRLDRGRRRVVLADGDERRLRPADPGDRLDVRGAGPARAPSSRGPRAAQPR